MKLTFIGADHEVTGSMHFLETADLRILIDCGMEQGSNPYENAPLPVGFDEIDYILLTHAHIDHAGMIPYAYKAGFNGTVLATNASIDLDGIMLLDSAHIQEQEAEWKNRKGQRAGMAPVEPVYTVEEAKAVLRQFRTVNYGQIVELSDTVRVRFIDAGHLLGSASIEIWIDEDGTERKLVFSGDIGNHNKPLIRDPSYIEDADYIVMESTYGDRLHDRSLDHIEDLRRIVQETLDRGGNAVFPAFAVGRTQELLYMLRRLKADGLIHGHDGFPVYVDSPLAVQATNVFHQNLLSCYDKETKALVEQGINPISFHDLHLSVSVEESRAINFDPTPKVILSASGMCDAGRIRHHLKHNLWRRECSIVFAGYQAEGTLGRLLQDGADCVRLFGEEIEVKAQIETMGSMSSHADRDGLLEWVGAYRHSPKRIFLVHGEDGAMAQLAGCIREQFGYTVNCPFSGTVFDLAANAYLYEAAPKLTKKQAAKDMRNRAAQDALVKAAAQLEQLALRYQNCANADIKRMTKDINALLEKWQLEESV